MALASHWSETSFNEAFATNDLRCICRAVDSAMLESGCIVEIARAAGRDRTTLYRAFRMERGPNLDTMTKVLRALGFQLVVEPHRKTKNGCSGVGPVDQQRRSGIDRHAVAMAARFTAALRMEKPEALFDAFMATLREQKSVADFARKTKVSRENLYRVFSRNPRFGTFLDIMNALELQFAIQPVRQSVGTARRRRTGHPIPVPPSSREQRLSDGAPGVMR